MSKMTLSGLQSAMASYVDAAKQAGAWDDSANNFVGLLDKIGKQVTIDGSFIDKLPELEGSELPLGKTVEEYFIDLTLPETWTSHSTDGAYNESPAIPAVEDVAYSYTLGRQKIKTTVPYDNFERGCVSVAESANIGMKIMERLQNSYDLTRYAEKKQLLGNAIDRAVEVGTSSDPIDTIVTCAVPVDTETAEAFIKAVKNAVEDASFAHQGGLNGALIGAAPEMMLYIKKGIMSTVEVDALAGAFNAEKLALPCKIKVLDDFGSVTNDNVYAVLVDPRGIKLHPGYRAVRSHENGEGDFVNFVRHFDDTGFISKYTEIKVFMPE